MTTQQFNQSVTREIQRIMHEAAATNKANSDQQGEEWPSIEAQQAYWRERDEALAYTESCAAWFDQQGTTLPF